MVSTTERLKGRTYTQADIDKYNRGWAYFLVDILREKIDQLKVGDSGELSRSVAALVEGTTTLKHHFLYYGLYVAAGVGKGFNHGNGGDLLFMGDAYRASHGYGRSQVGAGLSERHMLSPKFERVTVRYGKNAGKEAALTRGKRQKADWFNRKYYYQLQRLGEMNALMYGSAWSGMMSSYLSGIFAPIGSQGRVRSNRF